MKISATIYGCVADKNAYSAIKITADKYTHKRVLMLNKGTANQAELFALDYVLSALRADEAADDLEITSSNAYVMQMTDRDNKGVYKVSPEKNLELVQAIRTKLSRWARASVVSNKKSPVLNELKADVKAFK